MSSAKAALESDTRVILMIAEVSFYFLILVISISLSVGF